ncbi:hypothetical protein ACI3KX_18380 [Microbacterium sp. ZW CA_36]|uniref:hypothetical protein n=1 Tax=Microbacterium sp. ZW CA_36 TaxID=3378078 RepID=UPI0038545E4D
MEPALQGERDFLIGDERNLAGPYNGVSNGRSLTFVLQNLRSRVADFNACYAPIQAGLRADPTARFCHDLRSKIEKQGHHGGAQNTLHAWELNTRDLLAAAPPGTTGMFIADHLSRSGWNVEMPDGTERVVYFTIPAPVASTSPLLEGAPDPLSIERPVSASAVGRVQRAHDGHARQSTPAVTRPPLMSVVSV